MNSTKSSVLPDFSALAFRSHDIRGAVPELLNPRFAHALGTAIGEKADGPVVVGRDGRSSSVELAAALQAGIRAAGSDVIDIGMATTPMAVFTSRLTDTPHSVVVTGGHQSAGNNGFKIVLDGVPANEGVIERLRQRMNQPEYSAPVAGRRSHLQTAHCYLARIVSDVKLARPMKIAIDCGNGVTGALAPRLFRELGCDVVELFSDVDGDFPNHTPDPTNPDNLQELIYCLRYTDCELGLAFDGDGDCFGVVVKSGEIIYPDRQLILFARDLLKRQAGARVLYDVKCSRHVPREIAAAGGVPILCKAGDSNFRDAMRANDALLAGEMSGRFYFKERWYGANDAFYAAARLLEIVSHEVDASALLEAIPRSCSTLEMSFKTLESEQFSLIKSLQSQGRFDGAVNVSMLDGVRVEYVDGFGVARPSSGSASVVMRFEADTPVALTRIQGQFRSQLLRVAPHLLLPF
jgi:phosphomannomutase/phosphoglucomutase